MESLFDSVHIPLYREYIEATGSHELAIVLNQLVFHDKWLSASQVKKYCLFDKSLGSVRLMLSRLVGLGFVLRVRKNTDSDNPHDNHKYTAVHLYRAVPDLAIRLSAYEPQLVGMIDGYDLKTTPCMVEAAILNKFRQFVHEDKKTATFSSAELKRLLYSEKSPETVRLKLKSLVSKGYIVPRHGFGRVYEYELNHAMLLNTRTPEVLAAQGNELLELFVCHQKVYHGHDVNINTQKSWLTSFRRMLQEGFDFAGIRHIIAYLPHDKEQLRIVKTPGKIRERYADLFALANVKLSRKRVRSYIYRLLHGLVMIRQPKPVVPISDDFHNGLEWLRRLGVYRCADGRYYVFYGMDSLYNAYTGLEDTINQDFINALQGTSVLTLVKQDAGAKDKAYLKNSIVYLSDLAKTELAFKYVDIYQQHMGEILQRFADDAAANAGVYGNDLSSNTNELIRRAKANYSKFHMEYVNKSTEGYDFIIKARELEQAKQRSANMFVKWFR